MQIPSKEQCSYILEMIESDLIDFSYTHPWAKRIIRKLDRAPLWLRDLATKKYQGDQSEAIRRYVFSEPLEYPPAEMEKFHVACLWLRYERRELSWATFLRLAGHHLDGADSDWGCRTTFHYLNVYNDALWISMSKRCLPSPPIL